MINLYESPWDKLVHGSIGFLLGLILGKEGVYLTVGLFYGREQNTAGRYMHRHWKSFVPFLWDWKAKEGKPTATDTKHDLYVPVATSLVGYYVRTLLPL